MTDRACKIVSIILAPFAICLFFCFLAIIVVVVNWILTLPIVGGVFAIVIYGGAAVILLWMFWNILYEYCIDYWRDRKTK